MEEDTGLSFKALILKGQKDEAKGMNVLRMEEVRDTPPLPGEATIRIYTASLNRRDYWMRVGLYPNLRFESVIGSDACGIVEAVGDPSDSDWIGKEVVINAAVGWGSDPRAPNPHTFGVLGNRPLPGTFAEKINVGVEQLAPIPPHLSYTEAACLPVAGITAWRAVVTRGEVRKGDNVLVTGIGGGVATFAVQFALARGAKVWVTSSSDEKLALARNKLGATGGVNYTKDDWVKELSRDVNKKNGRQPDEVIGKRGVGFDCIIDGSAGASIKNYTHQLLALGGRLVIYGVTAGATEQLNFAVVFFKQIDIRGSTMGSPTEWSQMLEFITQHRIVPIVDSVVPFVAYEEAFNMIARSTQLGKVVLTIDKHAVDKKKAKL